MVAMAFQNQLVLKAGRKKKMDLKSHLIISSRHTQMPLKVLAYGDNCTNLKRLPQVFHEMYTELLAQKHVFCMCYFIFYQAVDAIIIRAGPSHFLWKISIYSNNTFIL